MKSEKLYHDYLSLLKSEGLTPQTKRTSIKDKYDFIKRLSIQENNSDLKTHFQQVINAINELEKATGGGVIEEISNYGIHDGTEEFSQRPPPEVGACVRPIRAFVT